ncbi:MAG: dihydroorotase [Chloroflexus sp.]|uniref:dihydroorotase n=1 Tax=Chloroflexus sp. TaxID=1904827 RepID=UPI004049DA29
MRYLIKNGTIIDPANRVATIGDILVANGKVERLYDLADLHTDREPLAPDVEVINARGCVVAPGFTDLHTHLRQPGEEHKETIASVSAAAAVGGFTTLCARPTTRPTPDHAAAIRQLRELADQYARVRIDLIGALTMGNEGQVLSEMRELAEAGCIAFSDGGRTIANTALLRHALAYAAALKLPVMVSCQDPYLAAGGVAHEGAVSIRLGLPAIPAAAEEAIVARDIALAEATGAHLHISRVSTAGSVALIRAARARGVHVTAEVTPHHLTLSDRWLLGWLEERNEIETGRPGAHPDLSLPSWLNPTLLPPYDSSTRVDPPLRSIEHVEALVEGLRDGVIGAIATDHAPHALVDRDCEYGIAPPGISGLETALALTLTLVHRGEMDIVNLIAKLTEGPAQVLNRSPANLRPGATADIVIFDPERSWMVEPDHFASRGRNTPLRGQRLKGQVMLTMAAGKIVFRRDDFGRQAQAAPQPSRLEGILGAE